jgi:hypothetical protein
MTPAEKTRENRLRRMAQRQAMMVRKSRRRDPLAVDYDSYWLVSLTDNVLVAGGDFGLTIDDLEAELTKPRRRHVTKT